MKRMEDLGATVAGLLEVGMVVTADRKTETD